LLLANVKPAGITMGKTKAALIVLTGAALSTLLLPSRTPLVGLCPGLATGCGALHLSTDFDYNGNHDSTAVGAGQEIKNAGVSATDRAQQPGAVGRCRWGRKATANGFQQARLSLLLGFVGLALGDGGHAGFLC
jgi:hypothetical protein